MNTTQVPTVNVPKEWLEELIKINSKVIEASTEPIDREQWSFYIGCLQSHIYTHKYFQPQPDSVDLEEFAHWLLMSNSVEAEDGGFNLFVNGEFKARPFSEVLEAFKKIEGMKMKLTKEQEVIMFNSLAAMDAGYFSTKYFNMELKRRGLANLRLGTSRRFLFIHAVNLSNKHGWRKKTKEELSYELEYPYETRKAIELLKSQGFKIEKNAD